MSDQRPPSIDSLLGHPLLQGYSRRAAKLGARKAVEDARTNGAIDIAARAAGYAEEADRPSIRRVINCSGTILNTGLGRARLAPAAANAVRLAATGHSSLEIDLEEGARGDRHEACRELLVELTGAEDAHVVNNNAGALMLAVSAFSAGAEVLLSRGQSVEIGGSFRMPDVVRAAGARLVDVGTTNKTRLRDYEAAIGPSTRAILRCHPSNFKMTGFVEEPEPAALAALCAKADLKLIDDVGSGCLFDTASLGLPHEPTLREALQAGADVVTASGDKLMGGPQAGILLGSADAIAALRSHPMARALRVDKLTLAALEATLRLYANGELDQIPTYRALSRTDLAEVEERIVKGVGKPCVREDGACEPGGGSLPGVTLPSRRVSFDSDDPMELARRLRLGDPPVVGYIEKGRLWLDLKTVEPDDEEPLVNSLRRALQ